MHYFNRIKLISHILRTSLPLWGLGGFLLLLLTACGPDSKHVKLSGKLLNLNQGEFLVYSPDGAIPAVDTIYVEGGRFSFEPQCLHDGSLIIVMPNNQEIPVFVSPGKSYTIDGDAHNMKELRIKGSEDNDLMNNFRKQLAGKPDTYQPTAEITKIIDSNPESPVATYLVRRYYLASATPDYSTASKHLAKLTKAQPDNAMLKIMRAEVSELMNASAPSSLPSFSVIDTKGRTLNDSQAAGGVTIFATQASWDYDSTNQLNRIISLRQDMGRNWRIVVISLDMAKHLVFSNSSLTSNDYIIFDDRTTEAELPQKLAMAQTSAVVVAQNGKIRVRDLCGEKLYAELHNY